MRNAQYRALAGLLLMATASLDFHGRIFHRLPQTLNQLNSAPYQDADLLDAARRPTDAGGTLSPIVLP